MKKTLMAVVALSFAAQAGVRTGTAYTTEGRPRAGSTEQRQVPQQQKPSFFGRMAQKMSKGRAPARRATRRTANGTDFVLYDRSKTGMPVMHCEIPKGWVACGWVHWNEGSLSPVRYITSAYDTYSDDAMALGSGLFRQPSWEYQRLNVARELTDPRIVAQSFVREVSLQFVLKNVRVAGATYEEDTGKEAEALKKNRVMAARLHGVNCSGIRFGKLRFRFLGERKGRTFAVNYVMPYLLEELNGMSSVGTMLSVDACCTLAGAERERALLAKLAAFANSRLLCNAFEKMVNNKVHESRVKIMNTREEILQMFQDVNAYREEVFHGSTYSWEGVILDTSVVKSENGVRYLVDGNFDNYRIDEATNEYVCWNAGDVNPDYNPGYDERLGSREWKEGTKEN